MLLQLVIGTCMIGGIVVLHAFALDFIIRRVRRVEVAALKFEHNYWKPFALAVVVLAVFMAHVVEIWIWALVYYAAGALPDFENALYFSTTAFTTVGFGDVIPAGHWRLLGAIEGANGFMMFGWSTGFTFEVLSHMYRRESGSIRDR